MANAMCYFRSGTSLESTILAFFIVEEELTTGIIHTHVMRSRYYAVSATRLCELMLNAGFEDVQRLDGQYFQPVIVGTKPSEDLLGI